MKKKIVPSTGFEPRSLHSAVYYAFGPSSCHLATPAERIMPFKCSCLSATERRTTAAKRDDLHSKSLLVVKNKGQWNAKSGPKASVWEFCYANKMFGTFGFEMKVCGQKLVKFCAHTHTRGSISSKDCIV